MKTLSLTLLAAAVLIIAVAASNSDKPSSTDSGETVHATWLTNYEDANKAAAKAELPILIDFSGSDWCGWCIKLEKEVFSKEAFKEYADKNLILLLADFPRKKEQSKEEKEQNSKLAEKFGVSGFPTVVLVDAKGKLIAKTGYRKGGAEKYVKHLKKLLSK